jgi:hypothetical protein
MERTSPSGRQSPKQPRTNADYKIDEPQSIEQALAGNLLMKERTRANNKLNPYNGKPSQEIRPESLTFLTKNAGYAGGPREMMSTYSKASKEVEDFDSTQARYLGERSPKAKKHNTI